MFLQLLLDQIEVLEIQYTVRRRFGWKKFVLGVAYQNSVMVVVQKNFLDRVLLKWRRWKTKTQRTKRLCARRHFQRDKQALFSCLSGMRRVTEFSKRLYGIEVLIARSCIERCVQFALFEWSQYARTKSTIRHSIHFHHNKVCRKALGMSIAGRKKLQFLIDNWKSCPLDMPGRVLHPYPSSIG